MIYLEKRKPGRRFVCISPQLFTFSFPILFKKKGANSGFPISHFLLSLSDKLFYSLSGKCLGHYKPARPSLTYGLTNATHHLDHRTSEQSLFTLKMMFQSQTLLRISTLNSLKNLAMRRHSADVTNLKKKKVIGSNANIHIYIRIWVSVE